jgi:hypothetical protein
VIAIDESASGLPPADLTEFQFLTRLELKQISSTRLKISLESHPTAKWKSPPNQEPLNTDESNSANDDAE